MREPVVVARGNEKYLTYDRGGFLDAYLREEADSPALIPLHRIRFICEAAVRIRPVQLSTGELEGTGYATGRGSVVGNDAFVILSEESTGSQMSARFTDAEGNVSDWLADRKSQELKRITPEVNNDGLG
jgi:hypothetical protein